MISRAVEILRTGGLVVFPTETVYGLGADATNATAVRRIFTAKGRPTTNPLIVHVADAAIAGHFAIRWTDRAQALADRFWPGPLTLVLPKSESIVSEVTAGRETVGIRVPNHPLALQLLREFAGAVAAPSANRANHISPTSAADVVSELGDAVDLILDGGPCAVGIESTVLDLSKTMPMILRPGGVTREQIESVIGPVDLFQGSVNPAAGASSPGQHARHYSPVTPAFGFTSQQRDGLLGRLRTDGFLDGSVAVLVVGDATEAGASVIAMPADPQQYAQRLYRVLREQDARGLTAIHIELPPDEDRWLAVRDRILRATRIA
jgi:L-threonylcarbamoyladenylate synthase